MLAGGWPVKRGDTVFIKFNANNDQWYMISTGKWNPGAFTATNTDGRIARAVALMCKESGAKRIVIGESTLYPKSILADPEKYFTPEVMDQLNEAAAKEFRYGS